MINEHKQKGWVKIYRSMLDYVKNPKVFTFMGWCILKASHREHDMVVGTQKVHLMPGQFVTGRETAAKELGISEQEFRTLKVLHEGMGFINQQTTNKFTIISVVNWGAYQGGEEDINQQVNQPSTNHQPQTRSKEVKNKEEVVPFAEIVEAYHRILPELPRVRVLTDKRKKFISARWNSNPSYQNLDWWEKYFGYVRLSEFLMGKNNRGWTADLEFLVTESSFVKTIEGKYHPETQYIKEVS